MKVPGSSWNPSGADLDAFAEQHLYYEIRMLVCQAAFIRTYHAEQDLDLTTDIFGNWALEAWLLHARTLDDFLGMPTPTYDDVVAQHWLPNWTPRRFLDDEERRRLNAQIAHLAGRREPFYRWDPRALTERACDPRHAGDQQRQPTTADTA